MVKNQPWAKTQDPIQKKLKGEKWVEAWLEELGACLACMNP
jgi:hypothetical protein